MKRDTRIIAMFMALALVAGATAACAGERTEIHDPVQSSAIEGEIVDLDLSLEMIPLSATPAMFQVPTAQGTLTKSTSKALIDYSNTKEGYVMIKYMSPTTKELRVQITGPSGEKYTYKLKQDATFEVFPLSDGNGTYTIGVFEHVQGNSYSTAVSASVEVTLKDEFAPFLLPNQYVNFTKESKTVAKATELTADIPAVIEKIKSVYEYVIGNMVYDREFAQEVVAGQHSWYLPDVDKVLESGKGICFDYAALMTAMLRSQGIATKLVIGYAGKDYHAWINVYNSDTGEWMNSMIFFDGLEWKLMDPTFASSSQQSAAVAEFIGDGSNYVAKYLY